MDTTSWEPYLVQFPFCRFTSKCQRKSLESLYLKFGGPCGCIHIRSLKSLQNPSGRYNGQKNGMLWQEPLAAQWPTDNRKQEHKYLNHSWGLSNRSKEVTEVGTSRVHGEKWLSSWWEVVKFLICSEEESSFAAIFDKGLRDDGQRSWFGAWAAWEIEVGDGAAWAWMCSDPWLLGIREETSVGMVLFRRQVQAGCINWESSAPNRVKAMTWTNKKTRNRATREQPTNLWRRSRGN